MTDKLQELTQKLYQDGVEKAKLEAEKILDHAKEEKTRLLRLAREEAEEVLARAHREARELKSKVESEVRMSANQALALTRQQLSELITAKVSGDCARGIFNDPEFLKKCVELIINIWATQKEAGSKEICVRLPEKNRKDLENYLFCESKKELDRGIKIEFDEHIKSGFTISPKDGHYRLGFTDRDFEELIKTFLRPALRTFLFGKGQQK